MSSAAPDSPPSTHGSHHSIAIGDGGLTVAADSDGRLHQIAYGPAAAVEPEFPVALYPLALPDGPPGTGGPFALAAQWHDGVHDARLAFRDIVHADGVTTITLDGRGGLLEVQWSIWVDDTTALATHRLGLTNASDQPIHLTRFLSWTPLLAASNPVLRHFGGGWAAEWTPWDTPLGVGTFSAQSHGAIQPHLHVAPACLYSPDGPPPEHGGLVHGALIGWTADTRIEAYRSINGSVRLLAGSAPHRYVLGPGHTLTTAEVTAGWSTDGVGDLSQRYQRWVRSHRLRDPDRVRPIVWNTWEAADFDVDAARVTAMAADVSELGADVVLMDDGWFGTSHPRVDDTAGLGDWEPNPERFPAGLAPVARNVVAAGVRFGLWVEPEMVNPDSTLFGEHPEWVAAYPGAEPTQYRNQLVLDLRRDEVRRWIVDTVDRILAACPEATFVKWDANRPLIEDGSDAVEPERWTNARTDWHALSHELFRTITERHRGIDFMLCASGGGRTDPAALRWFHEVWPSDNTDAVQRVRIQDAMSTFFPTLAMAAHATRMGGRPLAFACAVAMSGRFGFDIDPDSLSVEERRICQRAIAAYRDVAGTVQLGTRHRLIPADGANRSAVQFVDAEQSVVFAYQLDDRVTTSPLQLRDLDPAQLYEVRRIELDSDEPGAVLRRHGAQLTAEGLWWPLSAAETAAIWLVRPDRTGGPTVIDLVGGA